MDTGSGSVPTPPTPADPAADVQFTVPVPHWDDTPPASSVSSPPVSQPNPYVPPPPPANTVPIPTTSPYAAQPGWAPPPARDVAEVDPLLTTIGVALFWITVGWWLFVVVRVLGLLARYGASDRILIETIDRFPEETVIAAVISVLAALVLMFGRGRSGRDVLGWSAVVLAAITVGVAVWRVTP
jgi:hypothetical protein